MNIVQNPDGTWRVTDVPLISTGIEYPLSTGLTTFTESQLADAVAALEDPAIVEPRIKLGHTAGYNELLVGDAEQAFGRIDAKTMHLSENGQTIRGDITGLPEWLASVMAIAYPNRSMEGNFDVETVTGRQYEMVITAISLLGVYWPGCQVLEDLPLWYGTDIPDGVEFDAEMEAQLKAGGTMAGIQADADTTRIRRQFYDKAMSGELDDGFDTYWWWIRAERVSDKGSLYLICEDEGEGDLYKVPVSVKGDEVNFGTPTAVTVEYPEKTAAARAAVVAGMRVADERVLIHASRADTGGPETTARKGASTMDEAKRKALAAALGLPEDATPAQISAASIQAGNELQGVEGGEPENAGLRGDEAGPEDAPPAHQTPPGTAPSGTAHNLTQEQADEEARRSQENQEDVEAGIVRVDKETWETTQRNAALAAKHEAERTTERRKGVVEAAIKAGKIPPARREHYNSLMKLDEEGTTAALAGLQASAVPLGTELGAAGGGDETEVGAGQAQGLPDTWFPDVAAKRIAASGPVTHAKEG